MLTTSAPAYKQALLTALQARADLQSVQVVSTYPGDTLRAQAIYFGKTLCEMGTPVMAGPRLRRQEDYRVEIHIDVCDGSNDLFTAEGDAFPLLSAIDDQIAQDASLGGVVKVSHLAKWESKPYFDETRRGWAVLITAEIAVMQRLN